MLTSTAKASSKAAKTAAAAARKVATAAKKAEGIKAAGEPGTSLVLAPAQQPLQDVPEEPEFLDDDAKEVAPNAFGACPGTPTSEDDPADTQLSLPLGARSVLPLTQFALTFCRRWPFAACRISEQHVMQQYSCTHGISFLPSQR